MINFKKIIYKLNPFFYNHLRLWYFKKKKLPKEFIRQINKLNKNHIVIDLGANIGLITEILAKTKAKVFSFEPNSKAFNSLRDIELKYSNVKAYKSAAGYKNCKTKLYHHNNYNISNEDLTQASSLKSGKENISEFNFEEVEEIDFSNFLFDINDQIELIKIDIEGYEIELINHLLDTGSINKLNKIFLETHDVKNPFLKKDTDKLKTRIKNAGLEHKFFYEWH